MSKHSDDRTPDVLRLQLTGMVMKFDQINSFAADLRDAAALEPDPATLARVEIVKETGR